MWLAIARTVFTVFAASSQPPLTFTLSDEDDDDDDDVSFSVNTNDFDDRTAFSAGTASIVNGGAVDDDEDDTAIDVDALRGFTDALGAVVVAELDQLTANAGNDVHRQLCRWAFVHVRRSRFHRGRDCFVKARPVYSPR